MKWKCKTCGLKATMRPSEFPLTCACGTTQQCADCEQIPPENAAAYKVACIHRGDELRRELCSTCKGGVMVKILSCEVYGACTIKKQIGRLARCVACEDYEPST